MTLLNVLVYPDFRLRQPSTEVPEVTPKILTLISDMAETMYAYKAVGIAAPQVGQLIRLFVLRTEHDYIAYINPSILKTGGAKPSKGVEGCLSFPGVWANVSRSKEVSVQYLSPAGTPKTEILYGRDAVAFQHEMDHLDGVLFLDKMGPLAKTFAVSTVTKSSKH